MDLAPLTAAVMLSIEQQWYASAGAKELRVREAFGCTMTRYAQSLNRLIDSELALQLDAGTTRRLRHIRESRQRSRSLRSA